MTNIVSKITMKKIGAQPASGSIEKGRAVRCAQVYGHAKKCETRRSNFDQDYTVFMGNFEAVNLATGEVFRSGNLILPAVFQNLLQPAVTSANGADVAFSVELGARHSEKGSVGYEWTATPLVESSERDALADLREATKEASAALLEGPAKTKKK